MRKVWRIWGALVVCLLGCADPRVELDARVGPADGGADAGGSHDAGLDALVDAPPEPADAAADAAAPIDAPIDAPADAGADAPAGECSVVPQSGCAAGEACRYSPRPSPPFVEPYDGPPHCVPAGPLGEGEGGSESPFCWDSDHNDRCQAGFFCWTSCRRYCDPGGAPCPMRGGSPQRCINDLGVWYCSL